MQVDGWPNLVAMFFAQAAELGDRPFLWAKRDGTYRPLTWTEAADRVAALARALGALGVKTGDRVALVSENRPEWLIADVAIMAAGGITVPAYTTNQEGDHRHVFSDSGAKGVIVSTAALAENVMPAAHQAPHVEFVISMAELEISQGSQIEVHVWDTLLARHGGARAEIAAAANDIGPDRTACLIYTSGTGGVPKGVMLSHGAVLSNSLGSAHLLAGLGLVVGEEVFLSFLPLSHSYEHTAGQFLPIAIGAQIYYAEGLDRLTHNMLEARPTFMTAVPRLYESMHTRTLHGVRQAGGWREKLFMKAVELGRRRYEAPGSLGLTERLVDRVLDVVVRKKVAARFGGRLKALVSGGAPLNYDIGVFFTALGLRLLQGYGQTEAAPVVSCNPPGDNRIATVGPPLAGVEVRIADDGEILVRGELVMQGYWENPEATADVLRDGWLYTGDVGEIDDDGYIRITDRKKDIIVNSGGDNLSPQRVEGFLTLQPEIAQAMVYGDRKPHIVALVVPDQSFAEQWAAANHETPELARLVEVEAFRDVIGAAVERVNSELSVIERVRRFALTAAAFSVENGLMTPTMKIRRHAIVDRHGSIFEGLYGSR